MLFKRIALWLPEHKIHSYVSVTINIVWVKIVIRIRNTCLVFSLNLNLHLPESKFIFKKKNLHYIKSRTMLSIAHPVHHVIIYHHEIYTIVILLRRGASLMYAWKKNMSSDRHVTIIIKSVYNRRSKHVRHCISRLLWRWGKDVYLPAKPCRKRSAIMVNLQMFFFAQFPQNII